MAPLTRFHYGPFSRPDRLSDDAFSARLWSPLVVAGYNTSVVVQRLAAFCPKMDVKEYKDGNIVTATFELPGLKPEDVSVDLRQNYLTESGASAATLSREGEEDGFAIRERRRGAFSRTLQLPLETKPEDVAAKLENGLLTVTFPRTIPEQQPQRIAIQ